MISEGHSYAVRHISGRYLALVWAPNRSEMVMPPTGRPPYGGMVYRLVANPMLASRAPNPIAAGQALREWYWDQSLFTVARAPVCACCGSDALVTHHAPYRCDKHRDRNPCAIEGCTRTRAAPERSDGSLELADDQILCAEHWRRFVPPHSKLRRTYHRFWRIAKRQATPENPHGWTVGLNRRFERFWRGLVAQARRKATEGHLDEAEINRMFGWDEERGTG